MKLYAVEICDRMKNCGIQARNIKLFKKYADAVKEATTSYSDEDLRVDSFLDGTAKVYDAKKGHVEYTDAVAYITIKHTL